MKNLGNQTVTSNSNFNKEIQEMEERKSGTDDMIEEMCISVKGKVVTKPQRTSKKSGKQKGQI